MKKNDGGSAFPFIFTAVSAPSISCQGMTLRDYFAAKALAGTLASDKTGTAAEWANIAYTLADAMLAERSKP